MYQEWIWGIVPFLELDPYSSGSWNSAEEVFHQNMIRMANMAFTPCFLEDLCNTSPIPFGYMCIYMYIYIYIYVCVCGLQYEPSQQKVFNTRILVGDTLPETNSSPLQIGHTKRKWIIFQPLIFRGKLAVSFREGTTYTHEPQRNPLTFHYTNILVV